MFQSAIIPLLLACMICIVMARMEVRVEDSSSVFSGTQEDQKTTTVIISFKGSNLQNIRNKLKTREFSSRTHRIQSLHDDLQDYANTIQGNVLNMLSKYKSASPIEVHQLWISNQVIVNNADLTLVKTLQNMEEVSGVMEDIRFTMDENFTQQDYPTNNKRTNADPTWGIGAIQAPEVWAAGIRGAGVVVANIDTGVRGTHEALRDAFREENGWFDPIGKSPVPKDAVGHGTHTTGTIVGRTNGIGVAPEAQWIACRGCDDNGFCDLSAFMRCGQWALCPTDVNGNNLRCDLAPHVVSNSWGAGAGLDYFDEILSNWIAANIAPIFSAGNDGLRGCTSHISPADSPLAISVGATDQNNQVMYFSSLGPARHTGGLKPEIAAPGWDILSASNLADNQYIAESGTSQACPHVAGLAALLYSKKIDLTYKQFRDVLIGGAQQVTPINGSCGGVSDATYPNNHVGSGRVSAKASIDEITVLQLTLYRNEISPFINNAFTACVST